METFIIATIGQNLLEDITRTSGALMQKGKKCLDIWQRYELWLAQKENDGREYDEYDYNLAKGE